MNASSILKAVNSVTDDWTKRRKREIKSNRETRRYYSSHVNFTDVAWSILPDAYAHASGNGRYTLPQRNFYYAARPMFEEQTGRDIPQGTFNRILMQCMNTHKAETASWKITAGARGTFEIPNTFSECRIPVGTLQIDDYLRNIHSESNQFIATTVPSQWPSQAPGQRYQALLYIEKEGFGPMLNEARIAERYDLAIVSCKGQSVRAARKLVDQICSVNEGLPLYVVHDFDKAGFEICNSLTSVSQLAIEQNRVAYHFENDINFVDFGLRLDDAMEYGLASEYVKFKGNLPPELTSEEEDFLLSNERIELNAFTCEQFIKWLESKLDEYLPRRLIPGDDVLEQAYRRAHAVAQINTEIGRVHKRVAKKADELMIPKHLRTALKAEMKKSGAPWDLAIYKIAAQTGS